MRIYELAKKLNVSSKEILVYLKEVKAPVTSHMSVVPPELLEEINKKFITKKAIQAKIVKKTISETTTKKDQKESALRPNGSNLIQSEKVTGKTKMTADVQGREKSIKSNYRGSVDKNSENDSNAGFPKGSSKTSSPSGKKTQKTTTPKGKYKRRIAVRKSALLAASLEPVSHISIQGSMPLVDVATLMGKQAAELIHVLLRNGMVCGRSHVLKVETIKELGEAFDITVSYEKQLEKNVSTVLKASVKGDVRWPIVVVMGHVDHGKTTLLDYIRSMNVAAREKGGITQHISAYQVNSKHGKVVFLDTPGHEAFAYLREHGSRVTDIAILVVAADDGVKPQTIEALKFAQQAGVTVIVAISKIDKVESSALDRVKRQLAEIGLVVEDWGGDTVCVPISAKTGEGINELIEMIVLQAELMDLKAESEKPAKAFVLESHLEKGYGPVATVISLEGTLKQGDHFICGDSTGRVRLLIDSFGNKLKEAGPSMPIRVVGFNDYATTGESLNVVSAKEYAKARSGKKASGLVTQESSPAFGQTLDRVFNIIIKTDTRGSTEAILGLIKKLDTLSKQVKYSIQIISTGVGDISESDIDHAINTHSTIIGFHVKVEKNAMVIARQRDVVIKNFDVVYHLIEFLEEKIEGNRVFEKIWKKIGEAVVKKVFSLKGGTAIAGCYLRDGLCTKASKIECIRNGKVVAEGKITSLQRDKKSVKEVHSGYEFAFMTDKFHGWLEDDIILCYAEEKQK